MSGRGLPGDEWPQLEHDEMLAVLQSPAQLGTMARVADAVVGALDYLEVLDVNHLSALHHWACQRRDEAAGGRELGKREAEVYSALANLIAWHTTQCPPSGGKRRRARGAKRPKRPAAAKRRAAGPEAAPE